MMIAHDLALALGGLYVSIVKSNSVLSIRSRMRTAVRGMSSSAQGYPRSILRLRLCGVCHVTTLTV